MAGPLAPVSNCESVGKSIQNGFKITSEVISSKDGIGKTAKLGNAIIALLGKVLSAMSEGWYALSNAFKTCVAVLDFTDIIDRIIEWTQGKIEGAWKIASRICLTIGRIFSVINFLEALKLIDLSKVVETISRIPVIGWIVFVPSSIFYLFSSSLSTVDYSLKIHEKNAKISLIQYKIEALELRKKAFEINTSEQDVKNKAGLLKDLKDRNIEVKRAIYEAKSTLSFNDVNDTRFSPLRAQPQVEIEPAVQNVEQGFHEGDAGLHWDRRIENDIRDGARVADLEKPIQIFNLKYTQATIENGKSIVAIICDVAKVAIMILGFIGLIVGGVLSFTSIPMLVLGAAVAALGLYKCFHDIVANQYIEDYRKNLIPAAIRAN